MQIRTVQVYPEDQNSRVRVPGRYYHRPLLAFVENPRPIAGFPSIVHSFDTESDEQGSILLKFLVRLSTGDLRAECRRAVLVSDRANALQAAGSEEKVVVQPWPLEHMIIIARNAGTQEVLASVSTGGLSGVGDDLTFWLKFTPGALEKFKHGAANKRIEFVFYYTYVGMQTVKGTIQVKGDKSVTLVVHNLLKSAQIQRDAPIFQGDRNAVARNISVKLEKTIRAENKDIIPLLNASGMMDRMFEPTQTLSFQELVQTFNNQKVEEQLAAYLKPLIVNLNENRTESDLRYDIREGEKGKAATPGGGFSIFGIVFGSASKEATDRALNRLENSTGVQFARAKNEEIYRPHQIHYCKLRTGWDQISFEESTSIYLKVGSESTYIEDTGVPAWFTDSMARQSIAMSQQAYVDRRLADKEKCQAARNAARQELAAIHEQKMKLVEEIKSTEKRLQEVIEGSGSSHRDPAAFSTFLNPFPRHRPGWSEDSTDKEETKKPDLSCFLACVTCLTRTGKSPPGIWKSGHLIQCSKTRSRGWMPWKAGWASSGR